VYKFIDSSKSIAVQSRNLSLTNTKSTTQPHNSQAVSSKAVAQAPAQPSTGTAQSSQTSKATQQPSNPSTQALFQDSGSGSTGSTPLTFTPTSGWTVSYSYTDCAANGSSVAGLPITMKTANSNTASSRPADGSTGGSGTMSGFSAVNIPIDLYLLPASPLCSWSVSVTE
jgi:hypothetical protein